MMFTRDMFACPCCGANMVKDEIVTMLNTAYMHFERDFWQGIEVVVTSGYRCVQHNRDLHGGRHSLHMKGLAADTEPILREQHSNVAGNHALRWWAFSLIRAGFTGIGQTHRGQHGGVAIHADIRHVIGRPPNIWAPQANLKAFEGYVYYFGW